MDSSLPTLSKDNDWLGFCPSAVKLQNGDRKGALKKRTDYVDHFSTSGISSYSCSAKGCAFQGHVSVDFAWKVVMKVKGLGLQCRWAFLVKSHMPQSIVTGKQYQYQCPVCIFQHGHAEGRIWKGTDIFLTHVATHRGKDIPSEVLHKLNIINDHVSDDKGNFDLNLFPSGVIDKDGYTNSESSSQLSRQSTHSTVVEKLRGRKPSTLDIGSGMMRTHTNVSMRDRADSVLQGMPPTPKEEDESGSMASLSNVKDQKLISITAEPWSAGLSEFHVEKEGDYLSGDF